MHPFRNLRYPKGVCAHALLFEEVHGARSISVLQNMKELFFLSWMFLNCCLDFIHMFLKAGMNSGSLSRRMMSAAGASDPGEHLQLGIVFLSQPCAEHRRLPPAIRSPWRPLMIALPGSQEVPGWGLVKGDVLSTACRL